MASEDLEHLVQVFPDELWGLIFGHVQFVSDYRNITRASAYFQAHLEPRRVHILFPEVLKHLEIINPGDLQIDQDSIEEVLPLRQVCVAWKRGVDQILQRRQLYEIYPMVNPFDQSDVEMEDDNGFEKLETLEDFLDFEEQFDATHLPTKSNPFITRAVELIKKKEVPTQDYLNACLEFVKNYGKHIWYFGLHVSIEDPAENIKFYTEELPEILKQVPNSKVLSLGGVKLNGKWLRRLGNELATLEYPILKNLEYLDLSEKLPMPVIRKIIDNNQHVEAVAPQNSSPMMNFYLVEMANLKRYAYDIRGQTFEAFAWSQPVGRLEKLRLDIYADEIFMTRLFVTLETKFSDTLTHLCLHASYKDPMQTIEIAGALRLANLKVLYLRVYATVVFDFLLPLSGTLEELTLSLMNPELDLHTEEGQQFMGLVQQTENVIRLYPFITEPKSSNIWFVFSKLKMLEIDGDFGWRVCTRMEWREAARQHNNINLDA